MLCANRGSGQSVDCPAQTVDSHLAQTVDPCSAQHRVRRHKLRGQDAITKKDCHRPRKAMLGICI